MIDLTRQVAERNELMRVAAASTLERARLGAHVDPEHLDWCRQVVARFKPLSEPLGTGQPITEQTQ